MTTSLPNKLSFQIAKTLKRTSNSILKNAQKQLPAISMQGIYLSQQLLNQMPDDAKQAVHTIIYSAAAGALVGAQVGAVVAATPAALALGTGIGCAVGVGAAVYAIKSKEF
jgi:hypothetical protein